MKTLLSFKNPITGKEYSGGNIEKLQDAVDKNNRFQSGEFATYVQFKNAGRQVSKGEKAAARLLSFGNPKLGPNKEKTALEEKKGWAKSFFVFAIEQTEPIEGWTPADADNSESSNEETNVIEAVQEVTPVTEHIEVTNNEQSKLVEVIVEQNQEVKAQGNILQGDITKAFLVIIPEKIKTSILDSIAQKYDIDKGEAFEKITCDEAECLLDYLTHGIRAATSALMQKHGFAPANQK
jgi:hypothetical protein